jgi:hypothetical protein
MATSKTTYYHYITEETVNEEIIRDLLLKIASMKLAIMEMQEIIYELENG